MRQGSQDELRLRVGQAEAWAPLAFFTPNIYHYHIQHYHIKE